MRVVGVRGGIYLVTVLDVSKWGLRISCSVEFATGTRVEVRWRGTNIGGEVRYTREVRVHEFHLGIAADVADGTDLTQLLAGQAS